MRQQLLHVRSLAVERSITSTWGRGSGSTLLLALLILGGIVATSLSIGTVVITRLRNVRTIDQSLLASYAAESGIEDILFRVRRRGEDPARVVSEGTLENRGTWKSTSTETTARQLYFVLSEGAFEQLDIVRSDGELLESNVRALVIQASSPESNAWLEVTWVPWILEQGQWGASVGRVLRPMHANEAEVIDFTQHPSGGTPAAYRVRLRAIGGDIGTASVQALRIAKAARDISDDDIVAFPARVRATVVGTVGGAQYASQVEFPPRAPLTSVFNYVLFSECDIVKGDTVECP